jgi:tRNA threonylcarbamoyladenosine biosynthesis protein TsaB
MRVLSLETSGTTGSVAVLEDNDLVAEQALPGGKRSAQSLVPTIQALLGQSGWKIFQVELLAVTSGPGSFTSLRIGVSTAKALAYAIGAEILGVNTLEVIARRAPGDSQMVKVVLDAQRDQLFAATLASGKAGQEADASVTAVIDNQVWLDSLKPGDVVSGPGLKRLADRLPTGVIVVDSVLWMPTAAVVGQIGFEQHAAGRRDDVFQLVPQYFRRTAAEEQWDRRQGPAG